MVTVLPVRCSNTFTWPRKASSSVPVSATAMERFAATTGPAVSSEIVAKARSA